MSQRKLKKVRQLEKAVEVKEKEDSVILTGGNLGLWEVIKKNWIFLVLLMIGAVAIYFNGMNGAFVSDDYATIPNNPDLMSITRTVQTMPNLVNLSNTFIAKIFGITDFVTSPTYVIEKVYNIMHTKFDKLIHIDLYRIESARELLHLDWEEIIAEPKNTGVCLPAR